MHHTLVSLGWAARTQPSAHTSATCCVAGGCRLQLQYGWACMQMAYSHTQRMANKHIASKWWRCCRGAMSKHGIHHPSSWSNACPQFPSRPVSGRYLNFESHRSYDLNLTVVIQPGLPVLASSILRAAGRAHPRLVERHPSRDRRGHGAAAAAALLQLPERLQQKLLMPAVRAGVIPSPV